MGAPGGHQQEDLVVLGCDRYVSHRLFTSIPFSIKICTTSPCPLYAAALKATLSCHTWAMPLLLAVWKVVGSALEPAWKLHCVALGRSMQVPLSMLLILLQCCVPALYAAIRKQSSTTPVGFQAVHCSLVKRDVSVQKTNLCIAVDIPSSELVQESVE